MPGHEQLAPLPRLVAVIVDLALSAVVTLAVFRCPPTELLWWPLWTADLSISAPFLAMIGLSIAHGTLSELAVACTAGKKLVGARVVSCDGSRPGAGAVGRRASAGVVGVGGDGYRRGWYAENRESRFADDRHDGVCCRR